MVETQLKEINNENDGHHWDVYKPTKQDCLHRQQSCVPAQVQQDK